MSWLRDIPGYEGLYSIDMGGNVFSHRVNRYLKPGLASSGYLTVALGRGNSRGIHELILTTFVGPKPDKYVTRHLNGDKLHNCIFNLEWSTYSQNAIDKKHHDGRIAVVKQIKGLLDLGVLAPQVAKRFGISRSAAYAIREGRYHGEV